MRIAKLQVLAVVLVLFTLAGSALGQHDWKRTVTVDPQAGAADHQTIQAAINDSKIGDDPAVRYTVQIFAGTYTENVTLGTLKENVDLVGIDRESVIIAPTSAGSGIKITSGTETSRNNRIANLTIITSDGHGIEIVKGTAVPKDIEIVGVTILAAGSNKQGIEGAPADTVRIFDCNIESAGGFGVVVGDNYQIVSSSLRSSAAAGEALRTVDKDGLMLSNCAIEGGSKGFYINGSLNIEVLGSTIKGVLEGVSLYVPGENVRFLGCTILAEGNSGSVKGVYGDWDDPDTKNDPIFQSCRIEAIGGQSASSASAVTIDNTELQLIDCDLHATSLNDSQAKSVSGIRCLDETVVMIGGSIETSQPNYEKAIDVFDLVGDRTSSTPDHIFISGTRFSKWIGSINAAGRPRSVIQRTIDVGVADADGVLTAVDGGLTESEQPNVTPSGQPDVYRVLSVTGNELDMGQDVYIIGTDWAYNDITEVITLSGTNTIKGFKPFRTVTKIILPAQKDAGETVTVGTTNKLGLYFPIASTSDVLQQGREASAATSYTLESIGTRDATYSTVTVSSITAGDSFEWAILASQ